MKIPTWISKDLFAQALRNYHNTENVRILSFHSEDAVPAGENYVADLFRTSLLYYDPNR